MEWTDSAIVLHVRPHGENNAVVEAFTREHGRHAGLVRGGRSRKLRPVLQTGNLISAQWRARLTEHLGFFTVELDRPYAARILDDRLALAGLGSLARLAGLLAERDPHASLFDIALLMLDHIDDETIWPQLLVRWELHLLSELGVGLDLKRCVATGAEENLIYVSQKSACAVSAEAGEPYKHLLLPLPPFLLGNGSQTSEPEDILAGFALTGYFLERNVFHQQNAPLPSARQDFLRLLEKALA
jgi:DNA repair protein RecO (recombination protein O)